MSGPSSTTSPTALAFFDPGSVCLRMSQGTLLSEAPELLQRLPDWGTTADGVLYEHQTPARLIDVRDGSASLPTPRTSDTNGAGLHGDGGPDLRTAVTMLPTPTAQAAKHGATPDIHANGFGSNLWDLPHLLPTLRAQNGEDRNMKPWVRPLDQPQNLENAIARLLPTPTAQDGANNAGPSQWNRNSDPLNVVAVKLSGGTTPLPLNDGNEPSAGQHPHPPTTGNCPADSSNG